MGSKVSIKNLRKLTLPILIISFFSAYYASNLPKFGEVLTGLLAILGILLLVLEKKCQKSDFMCFLVAVSAMLYSNNTEGVRYFLLLCAIFTWSKFRYDSLYKYIKVLILAGLFTSLPQILRGNIRLEGFMKDSPPQFACVLLVCLVYLLVYFFNEEHKKKDIIYLIICLTLIYMSGTRSVLVAAMGACCYYIVCFIVQKSIKKNKKQTAIMIIAMGGILILMIGSTASQYINSIVGREAYMLADSSRTRRDLSNIVLKDLNNEYISWFIGHGAGYVELRIKEVMDIDYYLPVHQDLLLILAEFGLIGLGVLYYFFLKKYRTKWIFLYMFLVGSFHNILLATRTMLLMCIVVSEIENRKYNIISKNLTGAEKI